MTMAEYIMTILRSQLMVVFSWGFNRPVALPNNRGLKFQVHGFVYKGEVEITYNEGRDLFDVALTKMGKKVEDVYIDNLVNVIDGLVERCENYDKKVREFYCG